MRLSGVLISLGVLFTFAPTAQAIAPTQLTVEQYYLKLMNCTRTGGTVLSNGKCSGYGTGKNGGRQAPFILVKRVSDLASRPYAKLIDDRRICDHYYQSSPDHRLRYWSHTSFHNWGENIGCRDNTSAYASVLASHLNFQSEKSYNGWHWRNIKNPSLKYVGIGLWKSGTHIRFVIDFYAP